MFRSLQTAAIVLIAGCASNPNQVVRPSCDLLDDCFDRDRVRSFEFLDRDTLIVVVGSNRCPFLVELDGFNCRAEFAGRVAFYDNDRRICALDNAFLVSDVFFPSDLENSCRVRDVRAISEDELLERYASLGRVPPLPPVGSGELEVDEDSEAIVPAGDSTENPPEADSSAASGESPQ